MRGYEFDPSTFFVLSGMSSPTPEHMLKMNYVALRTVKDLDLLCRICLFMSSLGQEIIISA